MHTQILSQGPHILLAALSSLWVLVCFRALPFAIYSLLRRGVPFHARIGALLAYGCVLALAGRPGVDALAWSLLGLTYYALCACAVHWMTAGEGEIRGWHAGLLFSMAVAICLWLPSAMFPRAALATFGILGWELALKAYSFGLDREASQRDLGSCLFFFLVDPSIVYPQRAYELEHGQQGLARALLRATQGLLALLFGLLLLDVIKLTRSQLHAANFLQEGVLRAGEAALALLAQYGLHSGRASLQIAMMRAAGYGVAERYHYPLLARSPAEFWTRWNTYVGHWAKRYVYSPLALRLARGQANYRRTLATAFAVLVTFISIGALHDLYSWVHEHKFTTRMSVLFVANAVLILSWNLVARALRSALHAARLQSFGLQRAAFGVAFVTLLSVWMRSS